MAHCALLGATDGPQQQSAMCHVSPVCMPLCCVHGQLVVTIMMGTSWAVGFYGLYTYAVKKAGMQYAHDPANLELYKKRA